MSESPLQVHDAQLRSAWLKSVEFVDHDVDDAERPHRSYQLVVSSEAVDDERGIANLDVAVRWLDDEGEEAEGPFDISVIVAGEFAFDMQLDEEEKRSWLRFFGRYLLWPYARSYIAAVMAQSRLRPLTIFTLQMPTPRAMEPATRDFETQGSSGSQGGPER